MTNLPKLEVLQYVSVLPDTMHHQRECLHGVQMLQMLQSNTVHSAMCKEPMQAVTWTLQRKHTTLGTAWHQMACGHIKVVPDAAL